MMRSCICGGAAGDAAAAAARPHRDRRAGPARAGLGGAVTRHCCRRAVPAPRCARRQQCFRPGPDAGRPAGSVTVCESRWPRAGFNVLSRRSRAESSCSRRGRPGARARESGVTAFKFDSDTQAL
jgi:hypothetical protein